MKAIMLAAGIGRRLEGRHPPKPLLNVGGKSLLERHIEVLASRAPEWAPMYRALANVTKP